MEIYDIDDFDDNLPSRLAPYRSGHDSYSRRPVDWDPRYGWGTRSVFELLGRTAVIHAVLLLSYIHLQHVQKVQHTSRAARILRFILFGFMPSLVLAEVILNLWRTFLLFLRSDSNKLTPDEIITNWKRYLCGLAGMRVAPRPSVEEQDPEAASGAPATATTVLSKPYSPRLAKVQDSNDLERHSQGWTPAIVMRIIVLVLPILQAIGTVVLFARRGDHRWNSIAPLDHRNFVAAISSIACSIMATVILLCRSEWSLKLLNSSNTEHTDFVIRTFFAEIVIGSILNEAPFADWTGRLIPISWIVTLADVFGAVGIIVIVCFSAVIWVIVFLFDDRIKQKVTINWNFVLSIPVIIITIWIFVDLVAYFITDIASLFARYDDPFWDKDPIANFLAIC